jgi:hypothetical protein
LRLVATDGHRMIIQDIETSEPPPNGLTPFLITPAILSWIVCEREQVWAGPEIELSWTNRHAWLGPPKRVSAIRVGKKSFPNYAAGKPRELCHWAVMDRVTALTELILLSPALPDTALPAVAIRLTPSGNLLISTKNPYGCEAAASPPASVCSLGLARPVSHEYMVKALLAIDSEMVTIGAPDDKPDRAAGAFEVRSLGGGGPQVYVMPQHNRAIEEMKLELEEIG